MAPASASTQKAPSTPTNYYEEFLSELDEIRRYKWIESQKAAEDIGFERALVEWVTEHRDKWKVSRTKLGPTLNS